MRARRPPRVATVLAVAGIALTAAPAVAQQAATPIPGPLDGPLSRFDGAAATAQPLRGPFLPANPALAPDGRSGTGLAAGNGAASPLPGPLGVGTTRSSALEAGSCGGIAFDARGRVLAVCSQPIGPVLRLLDPTSLALIASFALPLRTNADQTDRAGGTHFIVRADGSLLVPTTAGTLLTIAVGANDLHQTGSRSLTGVLEAKERPYAVAAGYDGRDWVVGDKGTVVTVPRESGGTLHALHLREPVAEDLATDPSGTFVVTRDALYRLTAADDGTPRVVWRLPIPSGMADPHAGRVHTGPGTPPAIIPGGFVAVADAVNPPHVVVARIRGGAARRLMCSVPVFNPGYGSVEAPLVVAGRSIVVSNAYGYDNLLSTEGGRTTVGGISRIVVGRHGCRTAWASDQIAPSAQAVVSRATGLLYTVIKPHEFPDDWRLAALDWRTGAVRFSVLAGEGLGFNSDNGPVVLGPDGAAYAGSFGGISRWKDAR